MLKSVNFKTMSYMSILHPIVFISATMLSVSYYVLRFSNYVRSEISLLLPINPETFISAIYIFVFVRAVWNFRASLPCVQLVQLNTRISSLKSLEANFSFKCSIRPYTRIRSLTVTAPPFWNPPSQVTVSNTWSILFREPHCYLNQNILIKIFHNFSSI